MNRNRKVLWSEGMLLTPHHFQQWDNYYERLVTSCLNALSPYWWGVLNLEVVQEDIVKGTFGISCCQVVMPDGLYISIPDEEPPPDPVSVVSLFEDSTQMVDVYLAIPAKRPGDLNYQTNGIDARRKVRYHGECIMVADETTGQDEQPVDFACGNLRLIPGYEPLDGYVSVRLARIRRTGTGQFEEASYPIVPSSAKRAEPGTAEESLVWIPPAVNYKVSIWLDSRLREVINKMVGKREVLSRQRGRDGARFNYNITEIGTIWLLHTINTAIPALIHLRKLPLVHPERLYSELAKLAGALMTFDDEALPNALPSYEHENLYRTFNQLLNDIWVLLDRIIPNKCVVIPLVLQPDARYAGEIEDDYLLKEATFFLGIRSAATDRDLIVHGPRLIKLAAPDEIDRIVNFAQAGIPLEHTSAPDPSVPKNTGFQYFKLETKSPKWENVCRMKRIEVFVPGNFPQASLELYAVKP